MSKCDRNVLLKKNKINLYWQISFKRGVGKTSLLISFTSNRFLLQDTPTIFDSSIFRYSYKNKDYYIDLVDTVRILQNFIKTLSFKIKFIFKGFKRSL